MFKIDSQDLTIIIKAYGFDKFTATVVAEYLSQRADDLDLSYYLWNTLPFDSKCFKTMEEAEEYVENQLPFGIDKCTVFKGKKGIYIEWRR